MFENWPSCGVHQSLVPCALLCVGFYSMNMCCALGCLTRFDWSAYHALLSTHQLMDIRLVSGACEFWMKSPWVITCSISKIHALLPLGYNHGSITCGNWKEVKSKIRWLERTKERERGREETECRVERGPMWARRYMYKYSAWLIWVKTEKRLLRWIEMLNHLRNS